MTLEEGIKVKADIGLSSGGVRDRWRPSIPCTGGDLNRRCPVTSGAGGVKFSHIHAWWVQRSILKLSSLIEEIHFLLSLAHLYM